MKTYPIWISALGYGGVTDIEQTPTCHKQREKWGNYMKHLFSDIG